MIEKGSENQLPNLKEKKSKVLLLEYLNVILKQCLAITELDIFYFEHDQDIKKVINEDYPRMIELFDSLKNTQSLMDCYLDEIKSRHRVLKSLDGVIVDVNSLSEIMSSINVDSFSQFEIYIFKQITTMIDVIETQYKNSQIIKHLHAAIKKYRMNKDGN